MENAMNVKGKDKVFFVPARVLNCQQAIIIKYQSGEINALEQILYSHT